MAHLILAEEVAQARVVVYLPVLMELEEEVHMIQPSPTPYMQEAAARQVL
ncbi:hypothetical protein M495_14275 [Serratia liquefaciens ATCC 27592]|nr:hypothetical protein M495_14275 [Serratia liquefaciens ATCC 27592]